MSEINYISHLNQFLVKVQNDTRLNPTHVSMYLALFYYWNKARFSSEFFINRNDVMKLSRIGSKGTYHKCLHDLSEWKYIIYKPSHNPHIGSKVHLFNFGTSIEQVVNRYRTKSGTTTVSKVGQVSGPYINNNKHSKHYKQENQNSDYLKVENDKDYNQPL